MLVARVIASLVVAGVMVSPLLLTGCITTRIEKSGIKPDHLIIIRPGQQIPRLAR